MRIPIIACLLSGSAIAFHQAIPIQQTQDSVRMTGVDVQPLDCKQEGKYTHLFDSDSLRGQATFRVRVRYDKIPASHQSKNRSWFGNSATVSEPYPYKRLNNSILGESVLRFDRAIELNGQTIEAGTNLLEIPGIQDHLFFPDAIVPDVNNQVTLKTEHFHIPPGNYEVYFEWTLDDGQILGDTVDVAIDIDRANCTVPS
ncbi:hypothetical protein IQ249_20525 [Lusitaniella coriacea LEGE 07157]|uniref:Uncharacterized protein n=1 Tax=Lusitaniella coriacea LEGE 07157 TaxID=945747 RepID=A0A8J7DZ66_9CYAN|nr:hypothetical protein [Lusitaniella coriacea]MBE9118281.1 hypothetical protein [Lusitaniella coriacea LEGE 07157]